MVGVCNRAVVLLLLALSGHFLVEGAPAAGKIKHVVVLMEENRSFDHMFGWYPGVNGLTGKESNPVSTKDSNSKLIFVDKMQPMEAPCDPDHSTPATASKVFGAVAVSMNDLTNPTMQGFVEWEQHRGNNKTNYCDVMSMLTPAHVPIISTLASEFAVMDRFFAAHPGPTWPNRLFTLSATSAGCTETSTFYHNFPGRLYPQKTIFEQLTSEGLTWRNYYNDTPWEIILEYVALHPGSVKNMDHFYEDARTGNLPAFAWINPRAAMNVTTKQGSNDQHPDHNIAFGESYMKDIYEALRSSPQWNETLYIITYDEHGGYFDHVPTPLGIPPPGDGETSYPDKNEKFDRLGVRIPAVLISPWIPKGLVMSAPPKTQMPANNSEYCLTSIIATTRKLLGMKSGALTQRDAWSATFEHIFDILTEPRTDCPLHLPAAPPPNLGYTSEHEARLPVNDLQKLIMEVHANLAYGGTSAPDDITQQGQVSEWLQVQYQKHVERMGL